MEIAKLESFTDPQLVPDLRAALADCAQDLRALKRWWRQPPVERPAPPPTRSGLTHIASAKRRATLLHLALAHLRGRMHLRTWRGREVTSPADQAARLAEDLRCLDLALAEVPVLDREWQHRLKVMLARG